MLRKKRAVARFYFLGICIEVRLLKQKKKHAGRKNRQPALSAGKEAKTVSLVWEIAEPLCAAEGVELIHVEYQREPAGRILRLYIDKSGGVNLEDCAHINRQLGDVLEISLDDVGAYNLEVSSPGIERPLSRVKDFTMYRNRRIKVQTKQPINGRRNFTGVLEDTSGDIIHIRSDEKVIAIPFVEIKKARLVNHNGEGRC